MAVSSFAAAFGETRKKAEKREINSRAPACCADFLK